MKPIILAAATAFTLAGILPAHAQSQQDCSDMLTVAVGSALDREGFDTSNICDLTVADLAQIRAMLEEDGMSNNVRQSIELILAGEG
jgi:hypothetical protein